MKLNFLKSLQILLPDLLAQITRFLALCHPGFPSLMVQILKGLRVKDNLTKFVTRESEISFSFGQTW